MNHKDFAVTLVTIAPIPQLTGTTIGVTETQGSRLPITPFYANAVPPNEMSTLDNTEKILVTDITDDILTIERAQGETSARLIDVGWVLANCIYADDVDSKVDKVAGKGLSTEDYTTAEKSKLAGIAAGAEVNVQSDWDQANNTADDYIKNKPTLLDEKIKISATDTTAAYLGAKIIAGNNTVPRINNSPGNETISIDNTTPFVGANTLPGFTDNGDGSCTIADGIYTFNTSADGCGHFERFSVSGGTFTLTDGVLSCIVANYNSGTPAIQLITDANLVNDHTVTPIFTLFRDGIELHELDWDEQGCSQSDKLLRRLRRTERFAIEPGGLAIGELPTRLVTLTSGVVWYGATSLSLGSFKSDVAGNILYRYIYNGTSWSKTIVTQYDNLYYQGPTGQVELTSNRYAVNWVYRGVEDYAHCYIVLGVGDYTLTQAELATIPALLPAIIPAHSILVGKIIVQKSATTAASILSAFATQLTQSQTNDHNSLTNLQDAPNPVAGEHYHLSSSQAGVVSNTSGTNTGDQYGDGVTITGAGTPADPFVSVSSSVGSNSIINDEIPTGLVNGVNLNYTTASAFTANSLNVFINGVKQIRGLHFTETAPASGTFAMSEAPLIDDVISTNYQITITTSGNADTVDNFNASATPTANTLLALNGNAKIPGTALTGSYSTSEIDTGFTWVDGSTIYKKTINFGALPNATTKSVNHGITSLLYVINCEAFAHMASDSNRRLLPHVSTAALANQFSISNISDTQISVITAVDTSTYIVCYFTLYYTKTA